MPLAMGARSVKVQVASTCWASRIHKQPMSGFEIPYIGYNMEIYNTLQDLQGNIMAKLTDQAARWNYPQLGQSTRDK